MKNIKPKHRVVNGSHLDKCLKAIEKYRVAEIVIDLYETHHLLILNGAKIDEHINCTTKQAMRLIPFASEIQLIPTRGFKYHFSDYSQNIKQ